MMSFWCRTKRHITKKTLRAAAAIPWKNLQWSQWGLSKRPNMWPKYVLYRLQRYTVDMRLYTVYRICKQTHPCLDENHQLRYRSQHPALHAMKDPQVVFQLQVKSSESQNVSSRLRSRQTFSRVFLFFFNASAWPCARAVEAWASVPRLDGCGLGLNGLNSNRFPLRRKQSKNVNWDRRDFISFHTWSALKW